MVRQKVVAQKASFHGQDRESAMHKLPVNSKIPQRTGPKSARYFSENFHDNHQCTKSSQESNETIVYEQKRQQRLRENQAKLAELGIYKHVSSLKPKPNKTKQQQRRPVRSRVVAPQRGAESKRISRRLRGLPVVKSTKSGPSWSTMEYDNGDSDTDECIELVREWADHLSKFEEASQSKVHDQQLFLIPTGVEGVNDHTLVTKVPIPGCPSSHLWGFCEGLRTRIFAHIRPGDILLFTSSGCGAFNRIAIATETKEVSQAVSDGFWSRLSYNMGGTTRSKIGFPLLVLLSPPVDINWDKTATLKLLGYSDHLQSSRRIRREALQTAHGRLVIRRCLAELGTTHSSVT